MHIPRNPFILGHRIRRPYFCDRTEEQKNLTSAVTNGRNVVLIAPRRMGKTSLTYVSLYDPEDIRKDYDIFFFDILQTNSLAEFTYLLGKEIFNSFSNKASYLRSFLSALKSLKGCFGFDPVSGSPTFDIQLGDIKKPEFTLEEIFGYIDQLEKPVIMIIAEFQQVSKYPEENAEAVLRNYMQRMNNATFVFAGSEQTILREMFVSAKRPFYNSAEIMHLGPIREDLYVEFAQKLFEEREKSIDGSAIRWVFRLFDGNTYYLQRTMNGAFADTEPGKCCDLHTVKRCIRSMIASNEVIYREMLSNVSVSQKSVLYAIARNHTVENPMSAPFVKSNSLPSASSVQSALQKLVKSGLVCRSEEGYSLTDPLLRVFINGLYAQPELDISGF